MYQTPRSLKIPITLTSTREYDRRCWRCRQRTGLPKTDPQAVGARTPKSVELAVLIPIPTTANHSLLIQIHWESL